MNYKLEIIEAILKSEKMDEETKKYEIKMYIIGARDEDKLLKEV